MVGPSGTSRYAVLIVLFKTFSEVLKKDSLLYNLMVLPRFYGLQPYIKLLFSLS